MGVKLYDDALHKKITNWFPDSKITILKPDETTRLFQQRADQNYDKPIQLPLIAISREPNIEILSTSKKPLTFDGMMLQSQSKRSVQLDAIPIRINYQLDIYTRRFDEGDEYLREFIFNLINYPKMSVLIPYNDLEVEHYANVRVLSTVEDNSDIQQRLVADQFTRWTISLVVDDAYLFSVPIKDNVYISSESEITLEMK